MQTKTKDDMRKINTLLANCKKTLSLDNSFSDKFTNIMEGFEMQDNEF